MSDDEESAPAEPAGPPPPKVPKVVLGLLVANIALSGFAVVKLMSAPPAHAAPPSAHAAEATPHHQLTGPLVALEPFVVNLDEPGNPRYLKIQVQAEVSDAAAAKTFEKNKTLIHDEALGYLSSLKVGETLGATNKDRIRAELSERIGTVIGAERIRRVVFAEFVVQ